MTEHMDGLCPWDDCVYPECRGRLKNCPTDELIARASTPEFVRIRTAALETLRTDAPGLSKKVRRWIALTIAKAATK